MMAVLALSSVSCFRPGHLYMVNAWRIRNESDLKIVVTYKYASLYVNEIYSVTKEINPGERAYLTVNGCVAKEENLIFSDLFGKDINAFEGCMAFVDPETDDEVCRYDLHYNADNVLSRDFFNEAEWEVLDGAEFIGTDDGTAKGEPFRQWTFTVTDEYIQ